MLRESDFMDHGFCFLFRKVAKLEKRYLGGLESLEKQKVGAKRWINRQKVRLLAQVKEVSEERQQIAALIALEKAEYEKLYKL